MAQSNPTGSCDASQDGSTSRGLSPFLSLPAELRVEIYRFALVSSGSIVLSRYPTISLRSCDDKPAGVALLRTCTRIHAEATNVLYGENQFRCISEIMTCSIPDYLPRSSFRHLKELTIPAPFRGYVDHLQNRLHRLSSASDYDLQPNAINPSLCRMDFSPNQAIRQLLNAIANAPHLQQLNLLLDESRVYERTHRISMDDWTYENYSGYSFINNEDVWEDLTGLLRVKKALQITLIQLKYSIPDRKQLASRKTKRFLRAMRSRLGVWDVREMYWHEMGNLGDDHRTIPATREEHNPDEWLRAVRTLFED